MQLTTKIGIIGAGVVGNAIAYTYDHVSYHPTVKYDINASKCTGSWDDILSCHAVFVCVPSPIGKDGSCDTSILEEVLVKLSGYTGVIISKVTAPPTVYNKLSKDYPNLVYVPEFLTEANAVQDYIEASFHLVGGSILAYQNEAKRIIELSLPHNTVFKFCSVTEAALAKYTINAFLATKVVFMNEVKMLANALSINYEHLEEWVMLDPRFGNSHTSVPGPDGSYGFGGSCFPKDTAALLHLAESLDIELSVLTKAVQTNTFLRLK